MKLNIAEYRMEMEELNSILDASGKFPGKVKYVHLAGNRQADDMHYNVTVGD